MSDPIDRAAEVIHAKRQGCYSHEIARALDDAGLLVTPAHDAAVTAQALREAAAFVDEYAYEPSDVEKPPSGQERGFYLGVIEGILDRDDERGQQ